ncbi:hypothetical protein M9Y10_014113 [Tritrichomonas musculus]|uniref:NADH:flavin oxidoreductase/NADH oxidase N-terminal domain-containing protein n=1 Tax=Tritrichomonas musculus TaxID=1915356 RepID=A0ABR2KYU6_9EUKA
MLQSEKKCFTPFSIGKLVIPNRFIRSATFENLEDKDFMPSPELFNMTKKIAYGECGLIIPGFVFPLESEKSLMAWAPTIKEIHQNTKSKFFFQLCHRGIKSFPETTKDGIPAGASGYLPGTRDLTNSEIEEIIQNFVIAAKNSKKSGADGIQLHGAHGFLISAFLSPYMNRRSDKWGGNDENRLRFLYEIASSIRSILPDYPVSIKINGDDCIKNDHSGFFGLKPSLCGYYVKKLNDHKLIDMFEISSGIEHILDTRNIPYGKNKGEPFEYKGFEYFDGYNAPYASVIRRMAPNAVLSIVGGLRRFVHMEALIENNECDFISLCRPFIRNPNIVKDFRTEKSKKSDCISCGGCLFTMRDGPVHCVRN